MKVINAKRLILRGWQIDDLDDLYECTNDSNVGSMAGWEPHSNKNVSHDILKSYISDDDRWAVVLKETNKVIGSIKIYPDENRGKYSENESAKLISYYLAHDYWGKGYMTEAVKQVIKYAFEELNIELLTAFHTPQNIRSKRVIEKCGFQYETTIKQGYKNYDGQLFDSICYSILKTEYYILRAENISPLLHSIKKD